MGGRDKNIGISKWKREISGGYKCDEENKAGEEQERDCAARVERMEREIRFTWKRSHIWRKES